MLNGGQQFEIHNFIIMEKISELQKVMKFYVA